MDDRPLYDDEEEDLDIEGEEEEEDMIDEEEDDDDDTSSSNFAAVTVAADPITTARSSSSNLVTVALAAADPTRSYPIFTTATSSAAAGEGGVEKPSAAPERGLFQRLWTDEDEIDILRGFLDHISRRGGSHDAAVFYDEIKDKLRIDFNKSQLVEKLRRLKKKFRTASGKFNSGKEIAFKSQHDQATYEISKKIWFEQPVTRHVEDDDLKPNHNIISFHHNGGVDLNLKGSATPRKRARPVKSEEVPQFSPPVPQVAAATPVANSIPYMVEETVRSCLNPILKELVQSANCSNSRGFCGMGGISPMGLNFGNISPLGYLGGGDMGCMLDERWRKQQILELEVYSKRLALVQDHIKSRMEELRSKGS